MAKISCANTTYINGSCQYQVSLAVLLGVLTLLLPREQLC